MKIFYTCHAIKDLTRLRDFIAKENPKIATEISEQIIQAIMKLLDFPLLGREVKNGDECLDSIRELVANKYIIRYMVLNNKEIHVLRVWHNKENSLFH